MMETETGVVLFEDRGWGHKPRKTDGRGRQEKGFSPEPLEGTNPVDTLPLNYWPPEL